VPGCGAAMARTPRMLPLGWALTVVTSSLPITPALPARPGLQVLVTGGRAWSRTLAAAGRRAGNALAGVRAGVAVPGASGVFAACGLTTPDQAGAAARRAMIRPAGRRAVAAGHGRPGAGYFARFGERDEPGTLRADADAGDGLVPELGSGGLWVAQA
jgi:DeoR family transcriptional regulator, fructose operon transcriptional repressor